MKKILITMAILLVTLTGCVTDSSYIETVKTLSFDNGYTVEDLVIEKIKINELISQVNKKSQDKKDQILIAAQMSEIVLAFGLDEDAYTLYKGLEIGLKAPEDISWEIEGSKEKGKVIRAYTGNTEVKIETTEDGDYIQVNSNNIQTYDRKSNKLISDFDLEKYGNLIQVLEQLN